MKIRIGDVILIILFLISLAVVFWYLFGNSPTFEQTLLVLILTTMFGVGFKIAVIGEKTDSLGRKFDAIARDFKQHIRDKEVHGK